MKAYERLDINNDRLMYPNNDGNVYCGNINEISGSFMRDDVNFNQSSYSLPQDRDNVVQIAQSTFLQSFAPWSNIRNGRSDFLNDVKKPGTNNLGTHYPREKIHNTPSFDQISHLSLGFALVRKSIPSSLNWVHPETGETYNFNDKAKLYAHEIQNYLHHYQYKIMTCGNEEVNDHTVSREARWGGAFAARQAARMIKGNFDCPTNEWSTGSPGFLRILYISQARLAALRWGGTLPDVPDYSYAYWNILASILYRKNDCNARNVLDFLGLKNAVIPRRTVGTLDEVHDDAVMDAAHAIHAELAYEPPFCIEQDYDGNCLTMNSEHPILSLVSLPDSLDQGRPKTVGVDEKLIMSRMARSINSPIYDIVRSYLYDDGTYSDRSWITAIMHNMPSCVNANLDDYQAAGLDGWGKPNRFVRWRTEDELGSFNSLDYLLYHNLVKIKGFSTERGRDNLDDGRRPFRTLREMQVSTAPVFQPIAKIGYCLGYKSVVKPSQDLIKVKGEQYVYTSTFGRHRVGFQWRYDGYVALSPSGQGSVVLDAIGYTPMVTCPPGVKSNSSLASTPDSTTWSDYFSPEYYLHIDSTNLAHQSFFNSEEYQAWLAEVNAAKMGSTDWYVEGKVSCSSQMSIGMTLVPNPASQATTVHLVRSLAADEILTVVDSRGVAVKEVRLPAGSRSVQISTANLPAGLYYISGKNARTIKPKLLSIEK